MAAVQTTTMRTHAGGTMHAASARPVETMLARDGAHALSLEVQAGHGDGER